MRPLNRREQRILAIGLAVAMAAIAWLALARPLLDGFAARAAERESLTATYLRNERILAGLPGWRADAENQAASAATFALAAPSASHAADALRARVVAALGGDGPAEVTIQADDVPSGWVRVSAGAVLTLDELYQGLLGLESEAPHVVVDAILLAADGPALAHRRRPLAVQLTISVPYRIETGGNGPPPGAGGG